MHGLLLKRQQRVVPEEVMVLESELTLDRLLQTHVWYIEVQSRNYMRANRAIMGPLGTHHVQFK